jgi:hypothetical protein
LAHIESLLPLSEDALAEENARLDLYFKHIRTLEAQYSTILENVELSPYD